MANYRIWFVYEKVLKSNYVNWKNGYAVDLEESWEKKEKNHLPNIVGCAKITYKCKIQI